MLGLKLNHVNRRVQYVGPDNTEILILWLGFGCLFQLTQGAYWRLMATHYSDVIMGTLVSQITSLTIVYSTVY